MLNFVSQLLKSKTLIVNGLTVAAGTLAYWQGNEVIASNPKLVAAVVAALGVVNVALRLVTFLPVAEKTSLNK